VIFFIVAFIAGLFIYILTIESDLEEGQAIEDTPHRYSIIEIEGMPCILINDYHRLAITCDWSKYD